MRTMSLLAIAFVLLIPVLGKAAGKPALVVYPHVRLDGTTLIVGNFEFDSQTVVPIDVRVWMTDSITHVRVLDTTVAFNSLYIPPDVIVASGYLLPNKGYLLEFKFTNALGDSFIPPRWMRTGEDTVATGIHTIEGISSTKVYPNPFSDLLTIQSNSTGHVELFDANSREVKTMGLQIGVNTFWFSDIANGIYIMKITPDNGEKTKTIKLVKR